MDKDIATASVIIGFGVGRTFIFYDRYGKVSDKWENIFKNQPGWEHTQFPDHNKPLGWIATLSMEKCAKFDSQGRALVKAFQVSFGARLDTESLKAIFFTPGVGVLRFQLSL